MLHYIFWVIGLLQMVFCGFSNFYGYGYGGFAPATAITNVNPRAYIQVGGRAGGGIEKRGGLFFVEY